MSFEAVSSSTMVRACFVSVGVNRVANALDWGDNGLIAYAGHHIVCIYDAEAAEVVGTLTGHTGQVNCVKWLPKSVVPDGCAVLVSGAADNTIHVWAWHGQQQSPPWTCLAQLQGHESPVTSLAVQPLSQDALLLASTSADAHVRLWQCGLCSSSQQQQEQQLQQQQMLQTLFGSDAWQQQPPVHVGRHIQHCVALALLPEDPDCVLMATGGTDSTVRLFVREAACRSSTSSCSSSNGGGHLAADPTASLQQQQQGGTAAAGPTFKLQCQLSGHENWVKGVAFTQVREAATAAGQPGRVTLLLASAGQDRYGRIWCISSDPTHTDAAAADGSAGAHNKAAAAAGAGGDDLLRKLITRYAPRPHLSAGGHTYWVTLEALLIGHEDWLHSVSWKPMHALAAAAGAGAAAGAAAANGAACSDGLDSSCPGLCSRSDLVLLTASQDRSMMLWGYDTPNELWLSDAAIGDAGASCLGFYGGTFNPRGDQLVAHGYTGALHLWQQQQQAADGSSGSSGRRLWVPQHALGGHYGAVQDIAWGADGACLQSVGTDQTARLFTGIQGHWFELARTQVHGHDFSCLATVPSSTSSSSGDSSSSNDNNSSSQQQQQQQQQSVMPAASLMYVSGSEEKVLRVFEAPGAFTDSLAAVRNLQSAAAAAATAAALAAAAAGSSSDGGGAAAGPGRGRALGAAVAALGLSNKALFVDDDEESGGHAAAADSSGPSRATTGFESYNEGPDFVPCAVPGVVSGPPLEEHLAQNTLWPEVRKLYGHGNDVFCVCASPSGRIVASACRAQSAGAAAVWVWEVGSWKALAQLPGHTLTVTQLEFSPDGKYLLSGSRDRSFSVWEVPEQYRAAAATGSAAGAAAAGASAAAGAGAAAGPDAAAAANGSAPEFVLLGRLKAAHSRIIWSVSWSHNSSVFATGSRDQTVRLWARADVGQQQPQKPLAMLPAFAAGVTAVDLSPQHVSAAAAAAAGSAGQQQSAQEVHLLAVGCEDGRVQVWQLQLQQGVSTGDNTQEACGQQQQHVEVQQLWCSQPWQQHAGAVRRLRWAPACVPLMCGGDAGGAALLASCGEDNSVRLFDIGL